MLGGGQLGRFAVVAARLAGYGTIVLDPDPDAPAGAVADRHLIAAYDDAPALDELAARCAVVTTEFENPPAAALQRLARDVVVAPPTRAVAIAQDRIAEKSFLEGAGIPVAPCAALIDAADLVAVGTLDGPFVVKTARLGYDGKGQRSAADAAGVGAAWLDLDRVPCIVERRLPLDIELSVVLARHRDGNTAVYPVAENLHLHGVLDVTVVPARVDLEVAAAAHALGVRIAEALDYVGVLAVEFFVSGGELFVNELAPRPHNSGHWTLDAAMTSQFAQQIRAVTDSALGATSMTAPAAAMVNLLGDLWFRDGSDAPVEPAWSKVLADPRARLHLYGKAVPRPGRKMGHLTVVGSGPDEVVDRALKLRGEVMPKSSKIRTAVGGEDEPVRHPPERIEIPSVGVVLRRHEAGDIDALHEAIEASRDHLRPYMLWADQDRATTATFMSKAIDGWQSGDDYGYLITSPGAPVEDDRVVGACGLHRRGPPGSIEIGYWLRADAVGRGVMTAAVKALTSAVAELDGITRVEIRCDVTNTRSAAIPKRLGYVHVGDEEIEAKAPGESGRRQIWACGAGTDVALPPIEP